MKASCCRPRFDAKPPRREVVAVPPGRASAAAPTSVSGRLLGAAQWLVPSALLALTPKCPVCLAAYVTVGTGIGLSLPTAAFLRSSMLLAGGGAMTFLVARLLLRLVAKSGDPHCTPG